MFHSFAILVALKKVSKNKINVFENFCEFIRMEKAYHTKSWQTFYVIIAKVLYVRRANCMWIRLIENFVPGRIFTFLIHDKFYTFFNYTLIHSDANVYHLSPNLAPINAHYNTIDFQSFTHLFPSSTLGFEDVNSLLQTISKTNMMRDQFSFSTHRHIH